MIKTIKLTKKKQVKVGQVQVQQSIDDSTSVKLQSSLNQKSQAIVPQEVKLDVPFVSTTGKTSGITSPSLNDIVKSLSSSDLDIRVPISQGIKNTLLPSYPGSLGVRPNSHSEGLSVTLEKDIEPYEQLTGISHLRPEIIMVSQFLPLFNNDSESSSQESRDIIDALMPLDMTDAGRYIDSQFCVRALNAANVNTLLGSISKNKQHVVDFLSRKRQTFAETLGTLEEYVRFMLALVRQHDRVKQRLDLRDATHIVETSDVIKTHNFSFTGVNVSSTSTALNQVADKFIPQTFSPADALVRLGFKDASVRDSFTSTKMWMQLALCLKEQLQTHSPEFLDQDVPERRSDNSATVLTRTKHDSFGINRLLDSLPSFSDVLNIQEEQLNSAVTTLVQGWNTLYSNVAFQNPEMQIAALANLISKEHRYSKGVSRDDVVKLLSEKYAYSVIDGDNKALFDKVFGTFPLNATQPVDVQANSLVSVAEQQVQDSVVMTFETKYIEGTSGVLTPGSHYYIDSTLNVDGTNFNTTNLDSLTSRLDATHRSLSSIIEGLNLLGTKTNDTLDLLFGNLRLMISDPKELVTNLIKRVVDIRTSLPLPSVDADNLTAFYTLATTNTRLKTLLFILTAVRCTKNKDTSQLSSFSQLFGFQQDNTTLIDVLTNKIIAEVVDLVPVSSVKLTQVIFSGVDSNFTKDSLASALKNGTTSSRIVESVMNQFISSFFTNDDVVVEQRTRFSGFIDSTMMMVAFDLIIRIMARYTTPIVSGASYIDVNNYQDGLAFKVTRRSVQFADSVNDLLTRLNKEAALQQQLTYIALNTIKKLSDQLKSHSTYLKSPSTKRTMSEVFRIIGNNDVFKVLMTEQQMMSVSSQILDIINRHKTKTLSSLSDVQDQFDVLDDSGVSEKMRDALYNIFLNAEYATDLGYNKKIVSVGLPNEFSSKLRQKTKVSDLKGDGLTSKQSDIINVVVYKVDVQNDDIIFKPQRYLFELSRFVVKNDEQFLDINERSAVADVIASIPTRDLSQGSKTGVDVTYYDLENKSTNARSFDDESYSFLSESEKYEIAHNHVLSYLLEVYVKLMTGVHLSEGGFPMHPHTRVVDNDTVKFVTDNFSSTMTEVVQQQKTSTPPPTNGVLFSSNKLSKIKVKSVSNESQGNVQLTPKGSQQPTGFSSISHRTLPTALHGLKTISSLSNMITPLAGDNQVKQRMLSPGQFDKVLNIIIDPDDFEIDYEKTVKTEQGKQALEQLISVGEVIPVNSDRVKSRLQLTKNSSNLLTSPTGRSTSRTSSSTRTYKLKDRDRSAGDLVFEKYFVSIETFGEDVV